MTTPTSRPTACRVRLLARRRARQHRRVDPVQRAQRDLLTAWGAVGFSPSAVRASSSARRRTTI